MAPVHEQDMQELYQGRVRSIKVPFPEDPSWKENKSYTDVFQLYHSLYRNNMPLVPALMTYCQVSEREEADEGKHSVRLYYRSFVLKPIKWVIAIDQRGLRPMNTSEVKGTYSHKTTAVEKVRFNASVEFSSELGAEGTYKFITASASFKTNMGASYEKEITVEILEALELEPGQRISRLASTPNSFAKAGDFLAHGTGSDLVTTNNRHQEVEAKHMAQNSGFVKSVGDLAGLYDACGKTVTTYREEWKCLWGKMSSSLIKMVVDPVDARLYVMGQATCCESSPFVHGDDFYKSIKK
ncbi:hypothetical protein BGZ70_004801, partial [Mortierella alpina]